MGKQFTADYQPKKHTGPRMATILSKILSAKWEIKDKQIKTLLKSLKLKETLEVSVVLRRILNACEGDDLAIERIFDRVDGKVAQELIGKGFAGETKIILINSKAKSEKTGVERIQV
jgi:hypothetical protein